MPLIHGRSLILTGIAHDLKSIPCSIPQVWCSIFSPAYAQTSTKVDPHSPGPFRYETPAECIDAHVHAKILDFRAYVRVL